MKLTIAAKLIVSFLLYSSGVVSKKVRQKSRNNFLILMYHRILPCNETKGVQAGMYMEPATFRMHVHFLAERFQVVPLSNLFDSKLGNAPYSEKPFCALTFDDGWSDFYRYAYPILREYQVPATVFLPTDFIGTKKWFWTDWLAHILLEKLRTKKILACSSENPITEKLMKLSGSFESRLEAAIEMLKEFRIEEVEEILAELSGKVKQDYTIPGRAFLSWDEVRKMGKSGFVSFGSHTATHPILTTLKPGKIKEELIRSKEKLIAEGVVDDPLSIPFCYPNGNNNDDIAKMVKACGYSMAVTTRNGWNSFSAEPFTLKRIGMHQDMTSTRAMFGCTIINCFGILRDLFNKKF